MHYASATRTTYASNTGTRTRAVPAPDADGLEGSVANDTVVAKLGETAPDALSAGVDGLPGLPLVVVRDLERILGQHRPVSE